MKYDVIKNAEGETARVGIYDNGGKTFDRYTAVFIDTRALNSTLCDALGFNDTPFAPQGFGQHCTAFPGRHLGKRIAFSDLNADCQQLLIQNI